MMKNTIYTLLFLLAFSNAFAQEFWVKNNFRESVMVGDSGRFSINPYASAFFDDREYISDTKKGYTYPGFFIQPQLKFKPNKKTSISAGFYTLYFAGSDSVERFVPTLSLQVKLLDGIELIIGTLHSQQLHFLPEPLIKPERLFNSITDKYIKSQPETGIQFLTEKERFRGDSWTNWERYIKQGSRFQEVFTMGFSAIFKPSTFESRNGLTINLFGLAVHNGGQIDSSYLDVTTMINLAAGLKYCLPVGSGRNSLGVEATGFLSTDKSPNPKIKQDGKAIYTKLFMEGANLRSELGYWYASKFVNPRGEELFGSYSFVNPQFDEEIRQLITAKIIYSVNPAKGFNLGGKFETYYDTKSSILDWAFTIRVVFDCDILLKR